MVLGLSSLLPGAAAIAGAKKKKGNYFHSFYYRFHITRDLLINNWQIQQFLMKKKLYLPVVCEASKLLDMGHFSAPGTLSTVAVFSVSFTT